MLSDLDLNIAASTGIEDLNIADSAYDPHHAIVWAVDTEYGLIKIALNDKKFVGMPVERMEGGLVIVCAGVDGGAYGLTQRDGCVIKLSSDLAEAGDFTARGAVDISASAGGLSALFVAGGRLEVARLDDEGKELWRTPVQDIPGFPRGYRGTGVFAIGGRTIVISGDPKLQATILDEAGTVERRVNIDLPGGTSGQNIDGESHVPVSGRGRVDYLIGSAVDQFGETAAMLYRSPVDAQRLVVIVIHLNDPGAVAVPYIVKEPTDQLGGFDGDRLLCIGGAPGRSHGRIFTTRLADLETAAIEDLSQAPAKPRWWDKYKLKFNVDPGLSHADEIEEERGKFGGQDIRY